jgi:competence protein ComEA
MITLAIIISLAILAITFPVEGEDNLPSITFTNIIPESGTIYESYVDIGGAVAKPGLYKLTGQTRLGELVTTAGGFSSDADAAFIAEKINLAKVLRDEDKIYIPFLDRSEVSSTQSNSGLISINKATSSELESLPGVGEVTAQKIIDGRPYTDIAQLKDISGVGLSKYMQLSELIEL